jgi:hypothetical protein
MARFVRADANDHQFLIFFKKVFFNKRANNTKIEPKLLVKLALIF